MTNINSILIPLAIYILIPLAGLFYYLVVRKKMTKNGIPVAALIEMFILFATYGGLLTMVLTALFWRWSGMALLGAFYLILLAPIIMLIISIGNYQKRKTSIYYQLMFYLAISYYAIAPLTFVVLVQFGNDR